MSGTYYPEARVVVYATFEGTSLAGAGAFGSSLSEPVVAFPTLPLSADVQRNSYDQADSWSVDFDHDDFPIAPESLKACAVEIYIYDKGSLRADLASIAGTPARPELEPVVSGLVDSVKVESDGDGGRVVTLEGQDYTALFLQAGWKTTARTSDGKGSPASIPVGQRLDTLLERLISEVDVTGRIKLDVRLRDGAQLPVVGAAVTRTVRNGFRTDQDASYWSVMSKIARVHGFLIYVEGTRVVLTTPDNVFTRLDRLFRLRWGSKIKALRMERQLGKERVPQIEVRAYDDETRTTLVERYPAAAQQASTGIGTKRDERQVHVLYGVRDKRILAQFARTLYELIGRGEQQVEVETDDLRDEQDLDLLALRTGDAIYIEFDPVWREVRNLEPPQIYAILIEKGYPPNASRFLAENYKRLEMLRAPLYLREARISWDADQGVSVSATLINFVAGDGTTPA